MDEFTFYKYQGTGNDFVVIDNRKNSFPKEDTALVAHLCHRRFGVGADGLLLLENDDSCHFKMIYYNSDGNLGTMCGNGGRCLAHFARFLGIGSQQVNFTAVDGPHRAEVIGNWVALQMQDVENVSVFDDHIFLDTGSPHHVQMASELEEKDVTLQGRAIRNNLYGKEGANINFVEQKEADVFSVRTYERGVEAETLSCGTGVTAVAIAMFETGKTNCTKITLNTLGGQLQVRFTKENSRYGNVYLEGEVNQVFKGIWKWKH